MAAKVDNAALQDGYQLSRQIDARRRAMAHATVDRSDKIDALKRLGRFAQATEPTDAH